MGLWHISCNFNTAQFLFKSHHAEFDIADRCPCEHFAVLIKSWPLVIYLVKICDLLRPQIAHFPLTTLTSILVLGFTFSYSIILFVSLLCLPPTHQVFVIYILKLYSGGALGSISIFVFFLGLKKLNLIFIIIFTSFWLKKYSIQLFVLSK